MPARTAIVDTSVPVAGNPPELAAGASKPTSVTPASLFVLPKPTPTVVVVELDEEDDELDDDEGAAPTRSATYICRTVEGLYCPMRLQVPPFTQATR